MRRTPVYIVCSPRPAVGKTLIARALTEFLVLQRGAVTAFDINLREPSLLNYLPGVTETALISDTFGQMALMDRLIVNDDVPKVIDLGFHAFRRFFQDHRGNRLHEGSRPARRRSNRSFYSGS